MFDIWLKVGWVVLAISLYLYFTTVPITKGKNIKTKNELAVDIGFTEKPETIQHIKLFDMYHYTFRTLIFSNSHIIDHLMVDYSVKYCFDRYVFIFSLLI